MKNLSVAVRGYMARIGAKGGKTRGVRKRRGSRGYYRKMRLEYVHLIEPVRRKQRFAVQRIRVKMRRELMAVREKYAEQLETLRRIHAAQIQAIREEKATLAAGRKRRLKAS